MYISSGSTPRRLAAARKPSGAGLPTAVALRPRGLLHPDQVHAGVDTQPVGGGPRGAAVHGDDRHTLRHPVVDPGQRQVAVLRTRAAEQHHIGGLRRLRPGELARVDDVDAGHVLGDLAAVDQETSRIRVAVADVLRGQHRRGDDLVGAHRHARLGEQVGDLHPGAGGGVGQIRARNLVGGQRPQCLGCTRRSASMRSPRRHRCRTAPHR